MSIEIQPVTDFPCALGEGPLWHPGEQRLYWIDIDGHRLHSWDPSSGGHQTYDTGCPVGCLGLRRGGGFVLATKRGFALWDLRGPMQIIARPEAHKPDARFNDGAVDAAGRFWAGTYGASFDSALYRLDPGGAIERVLEGVDIPNGIGWDLQNRTMYFTDSTPRHIYAFDFDLPTGQIANRRVFVDSSDQPGVPDGLTVDAEGFIWSVRWGGWRIERFDPDGKLERTIQLPVEFPTSCCFGGEQLDDLYLTSAAGPVADSERDKQPLAGRVLRVRTGIRGRAEPVFAG